MLDEPANDNSELDPHERELIEALGYDPDDPKQVHEFYEWERSLEPDHWRDGGDDGP